jgi:acyl-CoA synthetase (AMP-forming)/AMP-acid ligase II
MRQFEVIEWLKTVHEQRISRTMLVPTMLKWVIDAPDFHSYDLSCLKVISYGAAPMPFEVIKKAIKTMPWVYFINAFGQTETASTITVLGPEDHKIEGTEELQAKKLKRLARSIGRPLPDIEIKIVDDKENELSPFNVGELFAKGSRVMSGYWNDAEKTAKTITDDGWLRTGDRGWMDEDGYIYLSGRADDMIIRGGENISPEEVEEVIRSNVSVYDCAVIGVEDAEWGQEIKAVVERKEGHNVNKKELLEYCRGKLAGFKRPRSVIFVDELPRNSMGKILKNELRERYGKEA